MRTTAIKNSQRRIICNNIQHREGNANLFNMLYLCEEDFTISLLTSQGPQDYPKPFRNCSGHGVLTTCGCTMITRMKGPVAVDDDDDAAADDDEEDEDG